MCFQKFRCQFVYEQTDIFSHHSDIYKRAIIVLNVLDNSHAIFVPFFCGGHFFI